MTIEPIRNVPIATRNHPDLIPIHVPRVDKRHEMGGDRMEFRMTPEPKPELAKAQEPTVLDRLRGVLRRLLGLD